MQPIYLFTIAGALAMAGALSASQVMQDHLSGDKQDIQAVQNNIVKRYLVAGNLAVISLVLAMIYGWQQFVWWLPVAFLIVTFPALYYAFLNRLLKPKAGCLVYCAGGWAALTPVILDWVA